MCHSAKRALWAEKGPEAGQARMEGLTSIICACRRWQDGAFGTNVSMRLVLGTCRERMQRIWVAMLCSVYAQAVTLRT